jgi:predicted DNA-binding transcriptional regulator YafY
VLAAADAASARRRVRFGYRTSQGAVSDRVVDAYGVVFRGGHWYLVGHDEERNAVRAFRLSRYTTELEDAGEGSAPPEGFRAIDHVEAGPWQLSADDRALVASAPGTVVLVESTFPGVVRERTRDDGWIILAVPAADEQALAAMLLQFGADVEALEPPTLRDEVIRRLKASVDA